MNDRRLDLDENDYIIVEQPDVPEGAHPLQVLFDMEDLTDPLLTQSNEESQDQPPVTTSAASLAIQIMEDVGYDKKEVDLDIELDKIKDLALEAFEIQSTLSVGIEPRFRSEAIAASGSFLQTALMAVKEKASIKKNKDKRSTVNIGNSEQTNIIVADRNELLKKIRDKSN
jgi:hypothetical protein